MARGGTDHVLSERSEIIRDSGVPETEEADIAALAGPKMSPERGSCRAPWTSWPRRIRRRCVRPSPGGDTWRLTISERLSRERFAWKICQCWGYGAAVGDKFEDAQAPFDRVGEQVIDCGFHADTDDDLEEMLLARNDSGNLRRWLAAKEFRLSM
jgi:hypothetical protein